MTKTNVSWLAVDSTKKDITIPGAYSLVEVTDGSGIAVAKADNYNVVEAKVTISKDTYVTDVFVDGTKVSVKA